MKQYKILVIIVSYNAMKWAERCYNSLRNSSASCDVITIDNGSTDGTQDFIRKNYPEVILVENKENMGFGKANNIGLQKALDDKYDYAYLLNQDAWVLPTTFEALIKVSEVHPEYGILSPMQMRADEIHFEDKFGNFVLPYYQTFAPHLLEDLYFNRHEDVYETSFVMAAHWLISAKCLSTVGGFSPTFPHYGEDVNYIHRTNYWKMKIGIVPLAKAIHDRNDSKWSKEKEIYVNDYIGTLVSISNPLKKESIGKYISILLKRAIRSRQKNLAEYAYRLIKEKAFVEANYKRSLKTKAFLQ